MSKQVNTLKFNDLRPKLSLLTIGWPPWSQRTGLS
jgi:hypothetical protein